MATSEAAAERQGDARLRLLDDLQRGDVDAVDAELDALAGDGDAAASPYLPLWRGMRALLEGRFEEGRRANQAAAAVAEGAVGAGMRTPCAVQAFHLSVEHGRLAEAEGLLRSLDGLAGPAEDAVVRASLAWLLGLLGRDGEARAELGRLAADRFAAVDAAAATGTAGEAERVAALALLAELVTVLDQRAEAAVLYHLLLPHRGRVAVQGDGAACLGSVSRHLGVLAHALGRWDDAVAHFQTALAANSRLGAPLLVAHTCRQWSALLRAGGDDRHWDRAMELLARAEAVYRRLGVDGLAAEASSVLARSVEVEAAWEPPEGVTGDARAANVFRRHGDEWLVRYRGTTARLAPARGLLDLACLLANPGRSFHVSDLAVGRAPADAVRVALGRAGLAPPWDAAGPDGAAARRGPLDPETVAEFRARLRRLDEELAGAVDADDRVTAALLRAERDTLTADLAAADEGRAVGGDPVDRARRAVATRIRLAIDGIDARQPALGRHLRHSVRIGTFCSYEPVVPTSWSV